MDSQREPRGPWRKVLVIVGLVVAVSACATHPFTKQKQHTWRSEQPLVILMPTDIELSELTAGGVKEPNALWTELANELVRTAFREQLNAQGILFLDITDGKRLVDLDPEEQQIVKLHLAVGTSILRHHYPGQQPLPHKKGRFEWTMGDSVRPLKDSYDGDYALFVFIRDSYTSGGRVAMMVAAALFGAQLQSGQQQGFASLVDLHTGEVVWFNVLARNTGDLRDYEGAHETAKELLSNFPDRKVK